MASKFKKGDRVIVLSGRDKGKTGEIILVDPSAGRAQVSGVQMVTRHQKQTASQEAGRVRKEAWIHLSNLSQIDPETQKPTRVGFRVLEDGRKVRYAKRSGEVIDV